MEAPSFGFGFESCQALTNRQLLGYDEGEAQDARRRSFRGSLDASLDEDSEIEEAWTVEVERRIADVESGAVQVIPMDEALAQVRAALK
jgi:hypothetical protein